jgi:hypothetical protein
MVERRYVKKEKRRGILSKGVRGREAGLQLPIYHIE